MYNGTVRAARGLYILSVAVYYGKDSHGLASRISGDMG